MTVVNSNAKVDPCFVLHSTSCLDPIQYKVNNAIYTVHMTGPASQ